MIPDEILYRCGEFDWVPLLGIWGAVGYAPLLVMRQYQSRQFIPATHGLAQCEFSYKDDNYKKKVREISDAWTQTRKMKRLAIRPMITPEYDRWWAKRVNDNVPRPTQANARPVKEQLQVIPSELEIIKQDFKRRSRELGKRIEQLEEEKMQLGLDVDLHKFEAEKLKKGKNKAEEDLDSLKADYKKLRLSIRTASLGKTSEQWRQEIKEEKSRADQWEKKFQDARIREDALKKSLLESQSEKEKLRAQVAELEKSLHLHRSRNSVVELRASQNKIEEMRGKIGELETALQDSKIRVELFWKEQLHHSREQIRNRGYIMDKAVAQIREVADHLQALAVRADALSLMYDSRSERGQSLAWLLRKVKYLGIRAKSYM
ncbi:golgin subfamily A member 5-like [Gossypium australe]|uniref:Golgin subfamily A member 5-like n=1 Tax=Gossypium australe TaxID=47621 RepID=A0A5B6WSP6_9ROSI|nr:golgin subfamily A member 5-like [Gossypium australe]